MRLTTNMRHIVIYHGARPSLGRTVRVLSPAQATRGAKARALFARVRERFVVAYGSAWACSSQPEHLLAYATWNEAHLDPDDGAMGNNRL